MTKRERVLSILVGSILVLAFGQWMFTKYKNAVRTKKVRLTALQDSQMALMDTQLLGAVADAQMGEFMVRSVSSDVERARSEYQAWLFEVVEEHQIREAKVSGERTSPVGDVYQQMSFELTGRSSMPNLLALIHSVQAKDYLHRIRELNLKPSRSGDDFEITVNVDVASLNSAPVEAKSPSTQAWRVDPDFVAYSEPILNRNLFEPPNGAPKYDGQKTLTATIGRDETFPLPFKDPEQHKIVYSLVEPVENVSIDPNSGTLRLKSDELKEFNVIVRAADSGYPKRIVDETLVVKVVDPPPETKPEPPVVAPEFDDAKQTYLSGLVQGGDDWTAWMNVRTRGKTLKLRVGDEFEIGSVSGKIQAIDADHVEITIGEKTIHFTSDSPLKTAVDAVE